MRININYHIDIECLNWAKKINGEISKLTINEIDFSSNKIRPHITLLMGEIEEENLPIIQKIVSSFKITANETSLELTRPYIKGEYVFVDVKNVNNIIKDYDRLFEKLKSLIVPHKHSIGAGNAPHLTLAYTKNADSLCEYIDSIKLVPKVSILELSADLTGEHGTVISNQIDECMGLE